MLLFFYPKVDLHTKPSSNTIDRYFWGQGVDLEGKLLNGEEIDSI
jgi:hypothetical protein